MNITARLPGGQPAKTGQTERILAGDLSPEVQSQRALLAGQLGLLHKRAERGLRIDKRSILNLLRVYVTLHRLGAA